MISWKSFKLSRVVTSSLGAERQAMATAMEEELSLVKMFMYMLFHPDALVQVARVV